MMLPVIFLAAISHIWALTPPHVTGTTPPPVECPDYLCHGKANGNYQHAVNEHYFVQCVDGKAQCQACWPLSLVFKAECNQCMYSQKDECITTQKWKPSATYFCPDKCPHHGPKYSGNMADPYNPYHYVACWKGVTVGCLKCPEGLKFNEQWNACLYDGEFKTKPTSDDNEYDNDEYEHGDGYEHSDDSNYDNSDYGDGGHDDDDDYFY